MKRNEKHRANTVSVMDYGAVGDGVADDTGAIQKALDSDAERVTVPPGIYRICSVLKPRASQCMEISGTIKISDAVIQDLQQDVQPGDSSVVVSDGSAYAVGQEITLYDEQLPIHLIDWIKWPEGEQPRHGATYQTRRINAGHARIAAINENTLYLDAASCRSYRCEHKACVATQHSAIIIEHDHVRICGTGLIDGNKEHQLDAGPAPLDGNHEENTAGCCIKVVAEKPLSGIIIEGITLQNAILHNLSLGVHNDARFPDCTVTDSVVRGVRSLYAHDKNIVIGRCRNCQVMDNVAAFAEYEDGIVLHQVADDKKQAASHLQIQGNACIGNARSGLHVGANMQHISLRDNICSNNGFNLVINGDDCSSNNDTVIGFNGRLFPLGQQRPGVLVAGRRITVENMQIYDSYTVALGISGEDIVVTDSLIMNNTTAAENQVRTIGLSISPGSACATALHPATGLQPVIMRRQADCCAKNIRISCTLIKGFQTTITVDETAKHVMLRDAGA